MLYCTSQVVLVWGSLHFERHPDPGSYVDGVLRKCEKSLIEISFEESAASLPPALDSINYDADYPDEMEQVTGVESVADEGRDRDRDRG